MKFNYLAALGCCLLAVSCDPGASQKPVVQKKTGATGGKPIKTVTEVRHTVSGVSEVKKLDVDGREVIIAIDWRNYSAAKDGAVKKWYGDMGRPPAKFVVGNFTIAVDGKGVSIPQSNYRCLASQWMNDVKHIGVFKQGAHLNVYVNVGDGAEAWTASYVIDPARGTLVSHQVYDGSEFHNSFAP